MPGSGIDLEALILEPEDGDHSPIWMLHENRGLVLRGRISVPVYAAYAQDDDRANDSLPPFV